jgi:hypothetical protein
MHRQLRRGELIIAYVRKCVFDCCSEEGCQQALNFTSITICMCLPAYPQPHFEFRLRCLESSSTNNNDDNSYTRLDQPCMFYQPSTAEHLESTYQRHCTNKRLASPWEPLHHNRKHRDLAQSHHTINVPSILISNTARVPDYSARHSECRRTQSAWLTSRSFRSTP